jgi:hypothetical protein
MATNPFVFLVGCPRSGTTLLQRLVDAHSHIAVTPETHWVTSYYQKLLKWTDSDRVTPKLVRRLGEYPRFAWLEISREEVETLATGEPAYADFVADLYSRYAAARGKPLAGDKTPGYARHLSLLHVLWPHTRFVHLLRDGRDVCLSALAWKKPGKRLVRASGWATDRVTTAALWWDEHVRAARRAAAELGPARYYELRYERLVEQPAEECARLCEFLGVPYESAILSFYEGKTRTEAGLDSKNAWLPVTPGLRDWRKQMAAADLERFEAVAGPLLDELGYPRGASRLRHAPTSP